MYCCPGFEYLVADAGKRGISAVAVSRSNGIGFRLQSRAVAYGDEKNIQPTLDDVLIDIVCEIGLQYCPFCGRLLQELINASPHAFLELATKHKDICLP